MNCAAAMKTSIAIANASPIASPSAASEASPLTMRPSVTLSATGPFHSGQRMMVNASERTIFAASGTPLSAATGRNAITQEMRASVNRKPSRVANVNSESACIAAQVPHDGDRVIHALVDHPRHQHQAAREKRHQARDRVESAVLNGSDHLNQADHDARHETDGQQRRRNPEGSHEHMADDVGYGVRRHA